MCIDYGDITKAKDAPWRCNEYKGRQRAGFKRREQQVLNCKGPQEVAGSRGRQKVIHRGSKRATVKAGKRLVT